jgi:hypothetical protein
MMYAVVKITDDTYRGKTVEVLVNATWSEPLGADKERRRLMQDADERTEYFTVPVTPIY